MAVGDDELQSLTKYDANPVLSGPPPSVDTGPRLDFRDPFVWRESDRWYMIVGSKREGLGGTVLLYWSPDLFTWNYKGPLLQGNRHQTTPFWTGLMWECPNFFLLNDVWHLILSVSDEPPDALGGHLLHVAAYSGAYKDHQFTPAHSTLLDYGHCFYAPQILRDGGERILMWGWLKERRSVQAQISAGWSGAMSLPRVLMVRESGQLGSQPAPELQRLRDRHIPYDNKVISLGDEVVYAMPEGSAWELIADIEAEPGAEILVTLEHSEDGRECTQITYCRAEGTLTLDTMQASCNPAVYGHKSIATISPDLQHIRLHLFLDHSIIELFADEGIALSDRVYACDMRNTSVRIGSVGAGAHIASFDVWRMRSIWPTG